MSTWTLRVPLLAALSAAAFALGADEVPAQQKPCGEDQARAASGSCITMDEATLSLPGKTEVHVVLLAPRELSAALAGLEHAEDIEADEATLERLRQASSLERKGIPPGSRFAAFHLGQMIVLSIFDDSVKLERDTLDSMMSALDIGPDSRVDIHALTENTSRPEESRLLAAVMQHVADEAHEARTRHHIYLLAGLMVSTGTMLVAEGKPTSLLGKLMHPVEAALLEHEGMTKEDRVFAALYSKLEQELMRDEPDRAIVIGIVEAMDELKEDEKS